MAKNLLAAGALADRELTAVLEGAFQFLSMFF
jgi:hypothetical protein